MFIAKTPHACTLSEYELTIMTAPFSGLSSKKSNGKTPKDKSSGEFTRAQRKPQDLTRRGCENSSNHQLATVITGQLPQSEMKLRLSGSHPPQSHGNSDSNAAIAENFVLIAEDWVPIAAIPRP
ncbi:MAG: hypothetical protein ABJC13_16940 [Acidobacteriota bacterium]